MKSERSATPIVPSAMHGQGSREVTAMLPGGAVVQGCQSEIIAK